MAAMLVVAAPLVVQDTVLDVAGHDVACAVRTVEYVPSSGGRTRGSASNRWTVECPAGTLTFSTGGLTPIYPLPRTVTVRAAGPLMPRPVAQLLPWWFRALPLLGALGLAALLPLASHVDRTRHL